MSRTINTASLIFLFFIFFIISCYEEGEDPPPLYMVNLMYPILNDDFVSLSPTLEWESENPSGTMISFKVYFDKNPDPITVVYSGSDTNYTLPNDLEEYTNYYWKVEVLDDKGNSKSSPISQFRTTGVLANEVSSSSIFSARIGFSLVDFNDQMIVIAGLEQVDENTFPKLNDVWASNDGKSWIRITESAEFSPRFGHTSVVFDNKIWVMGGSDQDDIWYSDDGIVWNESTSSAGFEPRYGHTSLVFNDKLWVIGGYQDISMDSTIIFNDVWYSQNGIDWVLATDNPGFEKRGFHSSAVFNNKMWVFCGGRDGYSEYWVESNYLQDAWYSEDGITWTKASGIPPPRIGQASVVFNNKLWIIAGISFDSSGGLEKGTRDIWYTEDGEEWIQYTKYAGFSMRFDTKALIYNNKVWLVGGRNLIGSGFLNDIFN